MRVGVGFLRILQFMNFVSFGIPRFADFGILRISSFAEFEIPCRSRALPRQRHAGEEAVREARARGRVFRTRFRSSSHARDAPRSLRSKFGKIENSRDFGILVVRFGPP